MRFNSNRSYIRHYLHYLLNKKVDVGERIFLNRSNPLFLNELPAVCVSFEGETEISVIVGSSHCPKQYERPLNVTITIVANNTQDNFCEDLLDELGFQIERAIYDDKFFSAYLEELDFTKVDQSGLLAGSALKSVTVYDIINEESNNIIIAHELNFELLYHTRAYTEKVMDDFEIVGLDIYISPESEK